MKLAKNQQGATLIGIAFILLLIGFVAFTALKLFPVYMQNFNVHGALQSVETDDAAVYYGVNSVRTAVKKRLNVNNVDQVGLDDIIVTREGGYYLIDINYEVTVPYFANMAILVSFKNHAKVVAQ